jgi:hypothetical protein
MSDDNKEYLLLKWGTLKGWRFVGEETKKLFDAYCELGASASAAMQHDTPEQKDIICKIIDMLEGYVWNDWTGEMMTKEEAKKYVLEYGKK